MTIDYYYNYTCICIGIATINSVDLVVFSRRAMQVVVETLLAGSKKANPKLRHKNKNKNKKDDSKDDDEDGDSDAGLNPKPKLKPKLKRQRSAWQHRKYVEEETENGWHTSSASHKLGSREANLVFPRLALLTVVHYMQYSRPPHLLLTLS